MPTVKLGAVLPVNLTGLNGPAMQRASLANRHWRQASIEVDLRRRWQATNLHGR